MTNVRPPTLVERLNPQLAARGWSSHQLAWEMKVSRGEVNDLLNGALLTKGLAAGLAVAFDTSPGYWLNLDEAYRSWAVTGSQRLPAVKLHPPEAIVVRASTTFGRWRLGRSIR